MAKVTDLALKKPTSAKDSINQMQAVLNRLKISLTLCWEPDPSKPIHGEIRASSLFIYDETEIDAWQTLCHEILEHELTKVTRVYQTLVNSLIGTLEQLIYERKERFVESLPEI